MTEHYPYRFKTRKEFEKEFGENWRHERFTTAPSFPMDMDYLLGKVFPYDEKTLKQHDFYIHYPTTCYTWSVVKYMLTENKREEPSYKPKKIIRTL